MEMKVETFSLLPKWIRILVGAFLIIIVTINIGSFLYIFFMYDILFHSNPPEIEIILSLSLAQISSAMIIGWLYLRFSWSQVNRDVIMNQVSNFLVNDMPFALNNIHYYYKKGETIRDINVDTIIHQHNSTSAYFKVRSKKWGIMIVYMQVNIRIIEVIYHIFPHDAGEPRFFNDVKNAIKGAETINWKAVPYGINHYNGPEGFWDLELCEMIMMKQVLEDDMFLLNTPKKIFWANDIAMMTKSFLEYAGYICE